MIVSKESGADFVGVRPCGKGDFAEVLRIINAAAEAYRGVIPNDLWHETYMPADSLEAEIEAGVAFCGYETGGWLAGVMGVQRRNNVDLVRHAYVRPEWQGRGVGSALMAQLMLDRIKPLLVGTWRAAKWAVRFYEQRGFVLVQDHDVGPLLRTYWTVPERQVETSVVLSFPALEGGEAGRLISEFNAEHRSNA